MPAAVAQTPMHPSRRKLLDAAVALMQRQGYTATTVDQICAEAGLTKGSFFHCFKSKEAVAIAAMDYSTCGQQEAFANVHLDKISDPVARLHAFFEAMISMIKSPHFRCACVVGNLAQETSQSNAVLRESCDNHLSTFVAMVAALIKGAAKARRKSARLDEEELAWMLCSLLHGSLMVARTRQDRSLLLKNVRHFRAYLDGLLGVDRS
jgi:TetR/AcrR family transcriptional repressor of nem operon